MGRMGTYTPFPLQCLHFRNVFPPDSGARAFSETIPSALASSNAGISFFSCYFWTRLLLSGYRCVQLATDRSSLLSFLFGEFVRERLVRVLYLDPTVSVQLYLVGTNIVSVIASWIPNVFPYSLSIIEAPTTFYRSSMPSVFFAAFKVWHLFVFR